VGLPRAACKKCLPSKDLAACTACARDMVARHGGPLNTPRTDARGHPFIWWLDKGVPTPPPSGTYLGCKRCTDAAAPRVCIENCMQAGPASSCWSCVAPPPVPESITGPVQLAGLTNLTWSVDGCMSCTKSAGPQWNDECL
jgi:hypothetical protein